MSRPDDWSPLRGSDPVPGDPAGVLALAERWAGTADAVETAVGGLRAVHAGTTVWRSASGRAFRERTATTASRVARVKGRYAAGAEVLAEYGRALEEVQLQADDARLRAQRAQDDLDAAERVRRSAATARTLAAAASGVPAPPDAAERRAAGRAAESRHRIARADDDLRAAEDAWRRAGRRAAAGLAEVADDGLDDRFDAALEVVESRTARLSTVSAASGLASVVPGLNVLAAPLAATTAAGAVLGTAVLWANDRASARDVAAALASPAAGAVGRASRLAALEDDAVRALSARPASSEAAAVRAGPAGRTTGASRTSAGAGPGGSSGHARTPARSPAPVAPVQGPLPPAAAPAPATGAAAARSTARPASTRTSQVADSVAVTADATTLSGPGAGLAEAAPTEQRPAARRGAGA